MSDLVTRAQIVMLAQTLDVEPERLRSLERLGGHNLARLRERISNVLFDEQAEMFGRISKLAPLMPDALVAKVAEKAIPPLVGGRAGGAVGVDHPDKAAGVLSKLSVPYMADAAGYLDPRTVAVLAPKLPAAPSVAVANELMRRRDYVTAARFVDFATPELVRAFEEGIDDNAGLLLTGAMARSADRLSEIVRLFPDARMREVISEVAAGSTELQLAGLSLLARIDDDVKERLGDVVFGEVDAEAVAELLRTAVEEGAVAELLAFVTHLSPEARGRAAAVIAALDEPTLRGLTHAGSEQDLRPALRSLGLEHAD